MHVHARHPRKICAIRAFVPNAGDGSGGTLDETGIHYASLRHTSLLRQNGSSGLHADREAATFRLFIL